MTIDPASYEPVYRQLARILRDQIQSRELRPGDALPSEATLAQTFGVGRDSVRDALASLRNDGLVTTTRASERTSGNQPRISPWSGGVRAPAWRPA